MSNAIIEKALDVIKWGLILVIAGIVFYVVYPKYDFINPGNRLLVIRCNTFTGEVDEASLTLKDKNQKRVDKPKGKPKDKLKGRRKDRFKGRLKDRFKDKPQE